MELKVNEPGLFIEELVFQVKPELVKRYVELEYEIMAKELAVLEGFGYAAAGVGLCTDVYRSAYF